MNGERARHWQDVYAGKADTDLTWHEDDPATSLELILRTGLEQGAGIVDIGGGISRLTSRLLELGYSDLTVLDLSQAALDRAAAALGSRGDHVMWVAEDVRNWVPGRRFDLWHDRAAFHFLTDATDRAAYIARLSEALAPGGWAVIATFAANGPEKCSGLPVTRYDPPDLARVLGDGFSPVDARHVAHPTPRGTTQAFQYSLFQRN